MKCVCRAVMTISRCTSRFLDGRFAGVRGLHQRVSLCHCLFDRVPRLASAHFALEKALEGFESKERTNKSPLGCRPADSLARLLSIVVVNTSDGLGHVDSNNGDASRPVITCMCILYPRMHIVTGKAGTTKGCVYG